MMKGEKAVTQQIVVRRARRKDLQTVVGITNDSGWSLQPITEHDAALRLLEKGYHLAVSRTGAALVGWEAENLVNCVDELFVYPPASSAELGPPLLAAVEAAAQELECEISVVLVPARGRRFVEPMLQRCGYRLSDVADLDKNWLDVLSSRASQGQREFWVKQLRAERVIMPI